MPILMLFLGALSLDLAYRGTEHEFAKVLFSDLGNAQFWAWGGSIIAIGALGYYSPARRISELGMALVILAMVLSNKGLFPRLTQLATHPPQPSKAIPLSQYGSPSSSKSGSGGSGGSGAGGAGGLLTSYLGGGSGGSTIGTAATVAKVGMMFA